MGHNVGRMNLLTDRLAALHGRGEKALIGFVTGGDPGLDQLEPILLALQDAGVDAIEVGIPFSDPIADGTTIQASSQRALDRGVTPATILECLAEIKGKAPLQTPLILMVYTNTILRMGWSAFAAKAVEAGVSGCIVTDLTPEESDEWVAAARDAGLETIFLAAPTSTDARLEALGARCSGFVYAVSRTGVTGSQVVVPANVVNLIERIKAHTSLPVCVGFGISKPEHVSMVTASADGAVVGSWLVDLLHREWKEGQGREAVLSLVGALKAATRNR